MLKPAIIVEYEKIRTGSVQIMERIKINFVEVDSKTSQLHDVISSHLDKLNRDYTNVLQGVQTFDGLNTGRLLESVDQNHQKVVATAQIFNKLLTFIDHSSKQVEQAERHAKQKFLGGIV